MSVAVSPEDLPDVLAELAPDAYVISTGEDGGPKVVHVLVAVEGDHLVVRPGGGTCANVERGSPLVLVFPAAEEGAMSLLADGVGATDGDRVRIAVESAVWHRSAHHTTP